MKKYTLEQIMEFVLKEAEEFDRKTSDEWCNRTGMGGPSYPPRESPLTEQVKFYKLGRRGEIPENWKQFIPPPSPQESRSANHPLQFEYCECGCKCHSGSSKGIMYSIFNDLKSKLPFTVRRGHSWSGPEIGSKYATWEEAVQAAQDDWDKIP